VSPGEAFLWFVFCLFCGIGSVLIFSFNAKRIVVALVVRSDLPLFPLARSIAAMIYQHPDQWSATEYRLMHPKLGGIWTCNGVSHLHVETEFGRWDPCWIERQIIFDATRWRARVYLANRIAQALRIPGP
jgi:hypothetical protein